MQYSTNFSRSGLSLSLFPDAKLHFGFLAFVTGVKPSSVTKLVAMPVLLKHSFHRWLAIVTIARIFMITANIRWL